MFLKVLIFFIYVLSTGCIQIPLGKGKVLKHKNTQFNSPTPNFQLTEDFSSDKAWINNKTGAIISYKSECPSSVADPKNHLQNISSQFSNVQVLINDQVSYNNRKAYRYKFKGEVEGILSTFDLLAFKKYGCFFIISHSGLEKNFSSTSKSFNDFISYFKVKK